MKTDDDIFVNFPLLRSHLQTVHPNPRHVITGCVKNGPNGAPQPIGQQVRGCLYTMVTFSPSVPDPVPDLIPTQGAVFHSVHPPFTAGAGYLVSGDLVEPLYRASLNIRLIK